MDKTYTDKELKVMFIAAVTKYVAKKMSKMHNISYQEAKEKFKASKTYHYLISNEFFPDEGPDYFLDWYQNELKYGRVVSSAQLYLEKKYPEEYREAGIIK